MDKHALRERIRFGSVLESAVYDESNNQWSLTLKNGETLGTQFLVSAVGQLHKPNYPEIPGADSFQGTSFHSANWNHDIDLEGKSVAVIGNAASAVQFVPSVARQAAYLSIYQRSANWLSPKLDRPYTHREKAIMRRFPIIKSLSRLKTYLRNELIVHPAIKGSRVPA